MRIRMRAYVVIGEPYATKFRHFGSGLGILLTEPEDKGGVWLTEVPVAHPSAPLKLGEAVSCFEIEFDAVRLGEFECTEAGDPHRSWLVPTPLLNHCPIREVRPEQVMSRLGGEPKSE